MLLPRYSKDALCRLAPKTRAHHSKSALRFTLLRSAVGQLSSPSITPTTVTRALQPPFTTDGSGRTGDQAPWPSRYPREEIHEIERTCNLRRPARRPHRI